MKLRIAPVLLASVSMLAWMQVSAQDGPTLYKTKCATCHGDQGQGKPGGAPKLAGTTKDVTAVLTKGGEAKQPHVNPMSTLTPAQVTALAAFVKTLK
jgi:mono/diheme cytochrome c family protein